MSDNALIEKMLDLPEFTVTDVKQNDTDIWIYVRKKKRPDFCEGCMTCDPILHIKEHKRNYKDVEGMGRVDTQTTVRDINMLNKRVGLIIDQIKWEHRDPECGYFFWEELDSVVKGKRQGRMTKRLRDYIAREAKNRSWTDLQDELGISDTTIEKIFLEEVDKLPPYFETETPKVIGIDEIYVQRPNAQSRKVPWAIIGNGDKRTAMEFLPDRNEETIAAFLEGLKNPENVRVVTMDMWYPYKNAVNTVLPQAAIVVDKPHILRMPDNALRDTLRDLNNAQLPKEDLMRLRDEAHRLKNDFYRIYDCSSRQQAVHLFDEWVQSIPKDKLFKYFKTLARSVNKWHTEVFNYFDHQYTNSFVERMNLTVRRFDLHSYGLSFKALRGKILFYTPRVLQEPRSNFGTTYVEMFYIKKPLCFGVSFDEIDKVLLREEI